MCESCTWDSARAGIIQSGCWVGYPTHSQCLWRHHEWAVYMATKSISLYDELCIAYVWVCGFWWFCDIRCRENVKLYVNLLFLCKNITFLQRLHYFLSRIYYANMLWSMLRFHNVFLYYIAVLPFMNSNTRTV